MLHQNSFPLTLARPKVGFKKYKQDRAFSPLITEWVQPNLSPKLKLSVELGLSIISG